MNKPTKPTRHSGPPPHEGWWRASISGNPQIWRWWDPAKGWSEPALDNMTAEQAAKKAGKRATHPALDHIMWTFFYPSGARVPRRAP